MATQTDPFSLSGLGIDPKILPQEFGEETLRNLDVLAERRERNQLDRLFDEQEERGLFRSGQTERRALEEVALPGIDARRRDLFSLVGGALGQGREERLGETDFQRTRQIQGEEFQRRLQELEQQLKNQRNLLQLQKDLKPKGTGFFGDFASSFASSFASGFGGGLGSRLGGG